MEIQNIIDENISLKKLVDELQEKLKQYTNPKCHKAFYEKNKKNIIENSNNRLKKIKETNPEKIKEYRRTAYLKRKEKAEKEKCNIKE